MAPKRKPDDDDDVGESTDEFANPFDDTMQFTKPVYLVAVRDDDQAAAYSVLKIDAAAVAGNDEPRRVRAVAVLTTGTEPGMSFVTARSRHGSWIVGVGGGLRAGTIIFDPGTIITRLGYPKHKPVLISHGSEPELVVGTYAFHVVNKIWEKIHEKNLPFVGQAVHLGGSLFAACPISNTASTSTSASVFHMSIKISSSIPSLSIQKFKVMASVDKITFPLFCPMGMGSFCCIRLGPSRLRHRRKTNYRRWRSPKTSCLKEVHVISTAFRIENIEAIMTHCQSQESKAKDQLLALQVKEQMHSCESKEIHGLLGSGIPVVAALSM
ncbi:Os11g0143600 [Oryza sativa Japonica Group]|uniref:Uncharacterized protein n=2 Tax=Oryza sativa subsp. japonica TaxID=39947 RepID=Q2RAN9_ORYSJ|nr:hypothetical protein LOC_Os11g04750 [Oryza sativa Japonica Group]BAF27570.1 Os11g0143600 [Oryza sativa Japonica Group]|eukprot:NP_001065725.1 Os11g0143600 [Oryza sativa Japonica Group]